MPTHRTVRVHEGPVRPPDTPLRRFVRANFPVAVACSLLFHLTAFISSMGDADGLRSRLGPLAARVGLGPLAVAALQLCSWLFAYRVGGQLARGAAGLMGGVFAMSLVAHLFRAALGPADGLAIGAYAYFAGSHVAFTLADRPRRRSLVRTG